MSLHILIHPAVPVLARGSKGAEGSLRLRAFRVRNASAPSLPICRNRTPGGRLVVNVKGGL